MIKKVGKHYVVYNHTGTKVLGKHGSAMGALKQLQAIEISKNAGEPGATKPKK